jgi:aryl-alcohol dehydrogenase-like predicted oxidoreductase
MYKSMINIEDIFNVGIGTYRMTYKSLENIKSMNYGINKGINLIDTASNYLNGDSEKIISKIDVERTSVFIVSKVGYITPIISEGFLFKPEDVYFKEDNVPFHSISSDYIKYQLKKSLIRCNLDYLDCYLLHNPEYSLKNKENHHKMEILEEAFSTLESFVKEGKIRYFGISSNELNNSKTLSLEELSYLKEKYPSFMFIQIPFNLIEGESHISLMEEYKKRGFYILSNRPLNTVFNNKSLRLSFFNITESKEFLLKKESELFNYFIKLIKIHLANIGIKEQVEEFYPLSYLINNRLKFGNIEAVHVYFNDYLYPFLNEIEFKNIDRNIVTNLMHSWKEIFQLNNNERLKSLLKTKGIVTNNLPKYLIEDYNKSGVDTVLMGLTKKQYIDDIFK